MAQGRASGKRRDKYRVKLTADERAELGQLVRKGKAAGWKLTRARALLKCDESEQGPGWSDARIAEALDVTTRSLEKWRKQAVERGPLSLLERKKRDRSMDRKLDGAGEAQLVKRTNSLSWRSSIRSGMNVSGRRFKKRLEAVASQDVVHPAGPGRGVRRGDGAGFAGVRQAVRPDPAGGVHGRTA